MIACANARASPQQHHQDAGRRASEEDNKGHLVYVDELSIQPSYENSVNPFLSHVEQARNKRLNPIHNHRKHLKIQFSKNKVNAFAIDEYDDDKDSINYPLEVDPEKPHFMEEDSYADATAEDTKDFGDEEKNFKDMLDVLFSSDY
ncbi:unnamed protein product [Orchesella dallaii]|uniref:Uncharacterized protein n=1 Tax=Orchesella dallaii TaxID=48710 RepID=A0ABP1RQK1_9HEXA